MKLNDVRDRLKAIWELPVEVDLVKDTVDALDDAVDDIKIDLKTAANDIDDLQDDLRKSPNGDDLDDLRNSIERDVTDVVDRVEDLESDSKAHGKSAKLFEDEVNRIKRALDRAGIEWRDA